MCDFCEFLCDKKNSEICVTKKKGGDYEEAKDHRAGGEGSSSRAHGIPYGNRYDQLYGIWTVLRLKIEN